MSALWRTAIGAGAGIAFGFAMYRFVGCRTGACPLNSNPWISMALWGFFGALIANGK